MFKKKGFTIKSVRKAISKNPLTVGAAASLFAVIVAAAKSERLREGARSLPRTLKQRWQRRGASHLIISPSEAATSG